jgi:hypothetical protein
MCKELEVQAMHLAEMLHSSTNSDIWDGCRTLGQNMRAKRFESTH